MAFIYKVGKSFVHGVSFRVSKVSILWDVYCRESAIN